jgi:hypothetical protein
MMSRDRLLPSLTLFAVFLASCAPAASTEIPAQPAAPVAIEPGSTPFAPIAATVETAPDPATPSIDRTATYLHELLSATPPVEAQPVATSRGPDLHATDPTTVSLASGQIQFVEFFRFT